MLEMLKSRPLNILNVFLNNERSLSAKELSIIFKKTERTIRNDIKGINEFLSSNKFIEIQNHSGLYELKISNYSKEKIKKIVSVTTDEQYYNPDFRKEFIIINALMKTNSKKIYEVRQELKISKSTMDKDMRNIRDELKQYDLQILSDFNLGLQIIGDERNIRIYIYNYLVKKITEDKLNIDNLFESYSPLVKYIGMNNIEEVKKTYQKIIYIQKNDVKESTIILTAIWLSRNEMGHILSDNNDDKTPKLSIINLFIEEVINRSQININLNEFNYINKRLEVLVGEDKELIVNKYETISQLITLKLIEYIEYQLSLNFDGFQNSLFVGLSKHISGLLGRIEQGIQIYNPLKENIKENHKKIFQTIQNYSAHRLNKYSEAEFTEDEIAFITVYFSTAYFKYIQENKNYFNAVIVCSFGIATSNLLAEILKAHFNVNIVRILSSEQNTLIDKEDVDVVFTTIDVKFNKPTCYVNAIVNEKGIKQIESFLEKYAYLSRSNEPFYGNEANLFNDLSKWIGNKGLKLKEQDVEEIKKIFHQNNFKFDEKEVQPMLKEVLKKHYVLLNQTCDDWEKAIETVSKPLLEDKVITPEYQDAMVNSVIENGPYIVIGKHIALAHARPEEGANELGVSIATLKPNVNFGNEINDPVKIIFCLSATDSFSHLNIMKSIVSLVRNQEKVEKLLTYKDKDLFIECLLEEEIL